MDDTFLQELDAHITNVGTDKVWKRKISGMEIWFSPIPYVAQLKVNEILSNEDLGSSVVQETKREALSNSIVGFDQYDLRKYRDAGPVFPLIVKEEKDGKIIQRQVKVTLSKYIYSKIAGWDAEFVDLAFEVFADLMESNKKDALKDVTFENAKDPMEELAEVEARAAEIREELKLPPLVEEEKDENFDSDSESDAARRQELEESDPLDIPDVPPVQAPQPSPKEENPEPDFDPFKAVKNEEIPEPVRSVPVPEPPTQPKKSPIDLELERREAARIAEARAANAPPIAGSHPETQSSPRDERTKPISSPQQPFQATPSVGADVVEQPSQRQVVPPPKIDQKPIGQSRNPRFNPEKRG